MKFYHGTSMEKWKLIQEEGVLWGVRTSEEFNPSRCTYLATDLEEAKQYGEIVLEIDYIPTDSQWKNNYFPDEWQHREYNPIPSDLIKKVIMV